MQPKVSVRRSTLFMDLVCLHILHYQTMRGSCVSPKLNSGKHHCPDPIVNFSPLKDLNRRAKPAGWEFVLQMDSVHVCHVKKKRERTKLFLFCVKQHSGAQTLKKSKSAGLLLLFVSCLSISSKIYLEENQNLISTLDFLHLFFLPRYLQQLANMAAARLWRRPVFVFGHLNKIIRHRNEYILLQGVCKDV